MTQFFGGVGSRETPEHIQAEMEEIAFHLTRAGFRLRSGAADGADAAFERGAARAGDAGEIHLAWRGFNQHPSPLFGVCERALAMASTLHPAWDMLGQGPRKLHARNCYQVLGRTLDTPCVLTVCWTPDGCESEKTRSRKTGGTGTAIALSERHGVPVYNLQKTASRKALNEWMAARGISYALPLELAPAQSALF